MLKGILSRGQRAGAGMPAPAGGCRRYFYLIRNFFWTLVGLNLLFILFSIPVITIPAAITAMNRVCLKLIREGHLFLWDDFREEFMPGFRKSVVPGLLSAFILFISYYLLSLGLSNSANIYGVIFNAAGLTVLFTSAAWIGYFFVLAAAAEQPLGLMVKNSFKLIFTGGMHTLGILLVSAACVFIIIALFPVSLFLILLCLPVLLQFTVCFLFLDLLSK